MDESGGIGLERSYIKPDKGEPCTMIQNDAKHETRKKEIITEIAELSRLLSMVPSDATMEIKNPLTQQTMVLSDWLNDSRDSLLKLSHMISRELDISLL